MFDFKIVEWRNRWKDWFEIFFLCYFVILLILSFLEWKPSGWCWIVLILGRLFFLILIPFLIIIEFSDKWIWSLNRLSHQVKNSFYRYSSASISDSNIIVQYEPPKWINSAEAWLLLHRYASSTDYFSLLYLWSSKWIITIKSDVINWNECIILHKVGDISQKFPVYQKKFFNNLFCSGDDCKLTELSEIHSYYDLYDLEKYWAYKWWFKINKFLWIYLPSGIKAVGLYFCIFLLLFIFFWFSFSIKLVLLFFVCCYLYKKLRRLKRTEEWDKLVEHLLWFREFVLSCDEKKFESFLKEDPLYYDEILSYAVVFWIETDLMKKLIPVLDKDIVPNDWTYWTWKRIGKFKK